MRIEMTFNRGQIHVHPKYHFLKKRSSKLYCNSQHGSTWYNPSTRQADAGHQPRVQGHPGLWSEFKASLDKLEKLKTTTSVWSMLPTSST